MKATNVNGEEKEMLQEVRKDGKQRKRRWKRKCRHTRREKIGQEKAEEAGVLE